MYQAKIKIQCKVVFSGLVTSGGDRRGASPIRVRRSKRRAAVTEAIDIGDTTKEAVNVNETIPVPVGETEPAENAEDTEKSVNASRAAEISTYTLA